jgi:hypothetical protein
MVEPRFRLIFRGETGQEWVVLEKLASSYRIKYDI